MLHCPMHRQTINPGDQRVEAQGIFNQVLDAVAIRISVWTSDCGVGSVRAKIFFGPTRIALADLRARWRHSCPRRADADLVNSETGVSTGDRMKLNPQLPITDFKSSVATAVSTAGSPAAGSTLATQRAVNEEYPQKKAPVPKKRQAPVHS